MKNRKLKNLYHFRPSVRNLPLISIINVFAMETNSYLMFIKLIVFVEMGLVHWRQKMFVKYANQAHITQQKIQLSI